MYRKQQGGTWAYIVFIKVVVMKVLLLHIYVIGHFFNIYDSPTSTDEESGGEDREVQILDEIKLERRAKSRVEG